MVEKIFYYGMLSDYNGDLEGDEAVDDVIGEPKENHHQHKAQKTQPLVLEIQNRLYINRL